MEHDAWSYPNLRDQSRWSVYRLSLQKSVFAFLQETMSTAYGNAKPIRDKSNVDTKRVILESLARKLHIYMRLQMTISQKQNTWHLVITEAEELSCPQCLWHLYSTDLCTSSFTWLPCAIVRAKRVRRHVDATYLHDMHSCQTLRSEQLKHLRVEDLWTATPRSEEGRRGFLQQSNQTELLLWTVGAQVS